MRPSPDAIVPLRCFIASGRAPSVGAEPLPQQAREARQIYQVEDFIPAREHRGRFERLYTLPRLIEGQRVILREGRESKIDQETQPTKHLVFLFDLSGVRV